MDKLTAGILCLCFAMVPQPSGCINQHIIDAQKIVNQVNNDPESTWKADTYGMDQVDVRHFSRSRLGARLGLKHNYIHIGDEVGPGKPAIRSPQPDLPDSFSWTDPKNTKCPISHIRDQSNCGSCWAVSTAAAFADRICIQSKGKINMDISAQYITSCDRKNYGCQGGYMDLVHEFLKGGVITGGDFESDEGCQPYAVRPCGRFLLGEKMPCEHDSAMTPKCQSTKCTNDWYTSKKETEKNTFKAKSWKLIKRDSDNTVEYNIQKDLYENGPLTLAFMVYEDFTFYKSGIYIPQLRQRLLGGHAVRLVGWGVENGIKYWRIANSWSTKWGEDGFFRIIRGRNAAFIEDEAVSAMPDLSEKI